MEPLVGTAEIRKMLGGISRERVYQLALRSDFPAPVAVLTAGKFWLLADVQDWMKRTGRQQDSAG